MPITPARVHKCCVLSAFWNAASISPLIRFLLLLLCAPLRLSAYLHISFQLPAHSFSAFLLSRTLQLACLSRHPTENPPSCRHHGRRIYNHQRPNPQKCPQWQLILARDRPSQRAFRAQSAPACALRERAPPASQVQG